MSYFTQRRMGQHPIVAALERWDRRTSMGTRTPETMNSLSPQSGLWECIEPVSAWSQNPRRR